MLFDLTGCPSSQLGHAEDLGGRTPKNQGLLGEEAFGLACDKISGQTVNGLWRIEKLVVEDGGAVMWGIGSSFRLRHLGSGRYLTLGEYEEGSSVGLSPPGVPPGPTTLLCFEETVQGETRTHAHTHTTIKGNTKTPKCASPLHVIYPIPGYITPKPLGHKTVNYKVNATSEMWGMDGMGRGSCASDSSH